MEKLVISVLFSTFAPCRPTKQHINLSLIAGLKIKGIDANKIYAITCCVAYWLDSMGYGLDFKDELKSLFVSYPPVDPKAMGFPNNLDF